MSLDLQVKKLLRQYSKFADDSSSALEALKNSKGIRDAHRTAIVMEMDVLRLAAALQRFIRDTQTSQIINNTRPARKMK